MTKITTKNAQKKHEKSVDKGGFGWYSKQAPRGGCGVDVLTELKTFKSLKKVIDKRLPTWYSK